MGMGRREWPGKRRGRGKKKKRNEKKRKEIVWWRREPLVVIEASKEKTRHRNGAHHMNIFTKMPSSLYLDFLFSFSPIHTSF